ncbi:MAG: hypothetical protein CL816_05850 [Coxiellaceae bacterium]|mgnify:CR=1 FL=1|nr:hypothetical protein [Coxiellaceae bacterium]
MLNNCLDSLSFWFRGFQEQSFHQSENTQIRIILLLWFDVHHDKNKQPFQDLRSEDDFHNALKHALQPFLGSTEAYTLPCVDATLHEVQAILDNETCQLTINTNGTQNLVIIINNLVYKIPYNELFSNGKPSSNGKDRFIQEMSNKKTLSKKDKISQMIRGRIDHGCNKGELCKFRVYPKASSFSTNGGLEDQRKVAQANIDLIGQGYWIDDGDNADNWGLYDDRTVLIDADGKLLLSELFDSEVDDKTTQSNNKTKEVNYLMLLSSFLIKDYGFFNVLAIIDYLAESPNQDNFHISWINHLRDKNTETISGLSINSDLFALFDDNNKQLLLHGLGLLLKHWPEFTDSLDPECRQSFIAVLSTSCTVDNSLKGIVQIIQAYVERRRRVFAIEGVDIKSDNIEKNLIHYLANRNQRNLDGLKQSLGEKGDEKKDWCRIDFMTSRLNHCRETRGADIVAMIDRLSSEISIQQGFNNS